MAVNKADTGTSIGIIGYWISFRIISYGSRIHIKLVGFAINKVHFSGYYYLLWVSLVARLRDRFYRLWLALYRWWLGFS